MNLQKNNFNVFEVSTLKLGKFNIPVSGGGYIRFLPWFLYKILLKIYLKIIHFIILYTSFELSKEKRYFNR